VTLIFESADAIWDKKYLGQNARQLVEEKYSWKIIGKKLNNIIYSSLN